jgi:ribonuclease P protein component
MKTPDSAYRFRQNLPKKERLCSEKIIARLFQSGVFVSKYPLRINALMDDSNRGSAGNLKEIRLEEITGETTESSTFSATLREMNQVPDLKVMFSVSKRRFPSAVDRNRIKRLLREVYRKDKSELWEWAIERQVKVSIAMIYTGNEAAEYKNLQKLWGDLTMKLIKKLTAEWDLMQTETRNCEEFIPTKGKKP